MSEASTIVVRKLGDAAPLERERWRRFVPDVLSVVWILAAAAAMLLPTLVHGANIHDPAYNDQADALIPWTMLSWTQVHHGYLPLWNPYSALGMPLAFNWGAASFGLPALVGYLFPLHLAYAAGLVTTLVVAGTGVYVFARLMGLATVACVFAAVAFELSGPFVEFLGWTMSSVMSWAGWMFAAGFLVVRGRRRFGAIAMLAAIVAAAIYAGEPETLIELGLAFLLFVAVLLVHEARRCGNLRAISGPFRDLVLGAVCGAALGAPLALPGLQLTSRSVDSVRSLLIYNRQALPLADIFNVRMGPYLGIVALILGCLAVVDRRGWPEVRALASVAIVMAGIVFIPPLMSFMNNLPYLGDAHWQRVVLPLAFAISVLAGMGVDVIARGVDHKRARRTATGFVVVALVVIVTLVVEPSQSSLGAPAARLKSILWVGAGAAVGAGILTALAFGRRCGDASKGSGRRRFPSSRTMAGVAFLALETAFLVAAGIPLWSASPTTLTSTPYSRAIQRTVRSAVVGFGNRDCFPGTLGILQDGNIVYGVHEFAVYDPLTPLAYFQTWRAETGKSGGIAPDWIYCPAVTSATLARRYGVTFVLEPHGKPGPKGGVYVGVVFDEYARSPQLYRIPGAARATLVDLTATGKSPGTDAPGGVVHVTQPNPAAWNLVTNSTRPGLLRMRLTNVAGWHASIDGHSLALQPFLGIMFQARVPAGRHTIELRYWPTAFSVGLALAAASAMALLSAPVVVRFVRGRSPDRACSQPSSR